MGNENNKKIIKIFFYILIYILNIYLIGYAFSSENHCYIIGILYLTFCMVFLIGTIKIKNENKLKKDYKLPYEYWREAEFKHIEPIYANYLLKTDKININNVIATLFFLERKEILNIDFIEQEYYISINNEIDENKINELKLYEKEVIKVFMDSLQNNSKVNLREKLKQFDQEYGYKIILKDIYNEIGNFARRKFYEKDNNTELMPIMQCGVVNMIFGILILVLTLEFSSKAFIFNLITYIMMFIFLSYFNKSTVRIKKEYEEEVKQLSGLYNYLAAYSLMGEKELKYVEIYNEFFIYAISLGIADKVEKEFNQKELNSELRTNLQILTNGKISSKRDKKELIPYKFWIFAMSGFLMPIIIVFAQAIKQQEPLSIGPIILMIVLFIPFLISIGMYIHRKIEIIKSNKLNKMLEKITFK